MPYELALAEIARVFGSNSPFYGAAEKINQSVVERGEAPKGAIDLARLASFSPLVDEVVRERLSRLVSPHLGSEDTFDDARRKEVGVSAVTFDPQDLRASETKIAPESIDINSIRDVAARSFATKAPPPARVEKTLSGVANLDLVAVAEQSVDGSAPRFRLEGRVPAGSVVSMGWWRYADKRPVELCSAADGHFATRDQEIHCEPNGDGRSLLVRVLDPNNNFDCIAERYVDITFKSFAHRTGSQGYPTRNSVMDLWMSQSRSRF